MASKTTALVDGDIVVYRSAFAAEHTYYCIYEAPEDRDSPIPGPFITRCDSAKEAKEYVAEHGLKDYVIATEREVEPVENVLYSIKHTLNRIRKELKAKDMRIFLSQGECFRHKRATIAEYKGNRTAPKPVHYQAARDYLVDVHGAEVYTTIEADDALALYQTKDTVICSIDKDLLQVEGKHYNWVREEKTLVKPRAALCRLYEQVLTGDATDNIPGINRMGPKTAKKLIADCAGKMEMEKLCIDEWAKALAKKDGTGVKKFELRDPSKVTPQDAMKEVLMLVKVGGPIAEEALDDGKAEPAVS